MIRAEVLDIFAAASESWKSTLDEEFDRLSDDVWLVEMLAFTMLNAASTLDDEFERLKDDV